MNNKLWFIFITCNFIIYENHTTDSNFSESRSYLSVRPINEFAKSIKYSNNCNNSANGQATLSLFGSHSLDSESLAKYFLFNNKTELICREQPPYAYSSSGTIYSYYTTNFSQDILTLDFNVATTNNAPNTFASKIKVSPKQYVIGSRLSSHYYFNDNWWVYANLPIVHVHNNMNLSEEILAGSNTPQASLGIEAAPRVANMTDAFKQLAFKYGKIDGAQSKIGFADLTILLGYHFTEHNNCHTSLFAGVIAPTSNKPTAEYMFEPITGNGGHCGLLVGSIGNYHLQHTDAGNDLSFVWNSKINYLFSNTQKRSLDLKNKPWSRYIAMYANEGDRAAAQALSNASAYQYKTFGINIMTKDVNVTPGFIGSISGALNYNNELLNVQIGCTTSFRQQEDVKLTYEWQEGPMIANYRQSTLANGTSNPNRTIGNNPYSMSREITTGTSNSFIDYQAPTYIEESDIDLQSASQPQSISNILFISMNCNDKHNVRNYEIGASYETSTQNSVMKRCALWGSISCLF